MNLRSHWSNAVIILGCSSFVACVGGARPPLPPTEQTTSAAITQSDNESLLKALPKVAGTYSGTLDEVEGSHSESGTVVIVLAQHGSNISGNFDVTFGSRTKNLTLSGTAKAIKKGVRLAFTVFNIGGRNATCKATVVGSRLNGTGFVPPNSSLPSATLTYKTTKR